MRYDKDAKLIYIGKKHINLMFNRDKKIVPVISNIFETMLKVSIILSATFFRKEVKLTNKY